LSASRKVAVLLPCPDDQEIRRPRLALESLRSQAGIYLDDLLRIINQHTTHDRQVVPERVVDHQSLVKGGRKTPNSVSNLESCSAVIPVSSYLTACLPYLSMMYLAGGTADRILSSKREVHSPVRGIVGKPKHVPSSPAEASQRRSGEMVWKG